MTETGLVQVFCVDEEGCGSAEALRERNDEDESDHNVRVGEEAPASKGRAMSCCGVEAEGKACKIEELAAMKRPQPLVRSFLDMEAMVDEAEDSDEEGDDPELQESFIQDDLDEGSTVNEDTVPAVSGPEEFDSLMDAYYQDLLRRVGARTKTYDMYTTSIEKTMGTIAGVDEIARLPCADDPPMWRVKCRLGIEETLVAYLLVSAKPKHELLSAFMPGNIHGYVYLECTMNKDLQDLLRLSPGVIVSNDSVLRILMWFKANGFELRGAHIEATSD
ncbi:hypothetical protein HYPSUDRAFT_208908 [Hypholoma sublateritium FD-334 SS-4]|uniref:NGN domain-containing protein n=1 Tax=Hypholoma sublateritium (strain FD-334 SS-4) TaxID=945553 RepID=A0A0D2KI19_HYPSF|nr:hypothetical protein HYPSUDRAFT_208908 [Hypholoma sublateritium FD-334 SS-4]